MSVYLYQGGFRLVRKSGIGQAVRHQEQILRTAGIPLARRWREAGVVHINTVFPDSAVLALLSRLCGKKVVYFGHSTQEDFRNSFHGSNLLAPLFRRWITFCYSLGDVILTPTEYARSLLESYRISRPIYALSNGIDTNFFAPDQSSGLSFRQQYGIAPDERVIISAGHYIERKGILDFLELARWLPEYRFIWFGYTCPRLIPRKIQEAITSAPENVLFPGYVSQKTLRNACCGADAFVFFSHEETEGIVVLEALACSIPVILRDIPVYRDWTENGKNVCKFQDIYSVPTILSRLFHTPYSDLHAAILTTEGRKVALSRNYQAVAVQLAQIYQSENLLSREEDQILENQKLSVFCISRLLPVHTGYRRPRH